MPRREKVWPSSKFIPALNFSSSGTEALTAEIVSLPVARPLSRLL